MSRKLEKSTNYHDDFEHDGEAVRDRPIAPGKVPATSRIQGMVFRMADPATARAFASGLDASAATAALRRADSSPASPLPQDLRRRFESSTGADLSHVRLHTSSESAAAADAIGARAYTVGQNIHFGAGEANFTDPFGLHLLAHEVAHTVQQGAGTRTTQAKLKLSDPGSSAEVQADAAADAMVRGEPTTITAISGEDGEIHRLPREGAMVPAVLDYRTGKLVPKSQSDINPAAKADPEVGHGYAAGVIPHNDDAYEQPPLSFAAPAANQGPLPPPAYKASSGTWPEPLPYFTEDCISVGEVSDSQRAHAAACKADFTAADQHMSSMWAVLSGAINSFEEAAKQASAGAPEFSEGAGWKPSGGSMDSMTDNQQVGPQGSSTTVGQVFDGNEAKVDAEGIKVEDDVRTRIRELKARATAKEEAVTGAQQAIIGHSQEISGVEAQIEAAKQGIELLELADDEKDKQGEYDALKKELESKKQTASQTAKVVSLCADAVSVALETNPLKKIASGAKLAANLGAEAYKSYQDLQYAQKLDAAAKAVADLRTTITNKEKIKCDTDLSGLEDELNGKRTKLTTFETNLKTAYVEVEEAYEELGKAINQAAGGGKKGAALQAAVEAIPKVRACADRVNAIGSSVVPPEYTEEAGIGAAIQKSPIANYVGMALGYQNAYASTATKWNERLASLQRIVSQFT